MSFEPLELPWLPAAPDGFRDACNSLGAADDAVGSKVQRLATCRLSEGQAAALGRAIARLREAGASLSPLSAFNLAVLPSSTFDFIVRSLPAASARHGVALETWLAPLGQIEQEVFNPQSELYATRRDAVLLGIDYRWLGFGSAALSGAEGRVDQAIDRLRGTVQAIARSGMTPIIPTIPAPFDPLFGSYDRRVAGSVRAMCDRTNAALPALCDETGAVLLDVCAVAELVGLARWNDPRSYNLFKLPFTPDAVPLFADHVGRLLGAMRGKSRKCLVLDLDNTCWGGVIGDDGLEGICLSGPEGEGFQSVQRMALELKARGVVLAVCSKNNDETARKAFRDHPDMLLREADIAVFQANWEDKPSNLEAIARTLDIGLDALVFLDDNGAERAQVRAALPMVATPEMPDDVSLYPSILLAAGYFEAIAFSEEDRLRSESYAANAQRAEVLGRARNLEDYLSSLDMEIEFAPFDSVNRARIAQLINKTNQFNLTTRRYTENEVAEMERGGAVFTLQTRLKDRYGDFGMIGVVVANSDEAGSVWEIDTWLMSCRVLGRQVEQAMLAELVSAARGVGVATLEASYAPTLKNGMVADHYDKLGFERISDSATGARRYRMDVQGYSAADLPFRVQSKQRTARVEASGLA